MSPSHLPSFVCASVDIKFVLIISNCLIILSLSFSLSFCERACGCVIENGTDGEGESTKKREGEKFSLFNCQAFSLVAAVRSNHEIPASYSRSA